MIETTFPVLGGGELGGEFLVDQVQLRDKALKPQFLAELFGVLNKVFGVGPGRRIRAAGKLTPSPRGAAAGWLDRVTMLLISLQYTPGVFTVHIEKP